MRGLCVGAAGCAVLVGAGVCFGLSLWSGFGVALAAEVRALTGEKVGAALGKTARCTGPSARKARRQAR